MFRSCLGIIFGLKRPNLRCIFSSKGRCMTSKIQISGQNLALWEGHFEHFQGQKARFLDFKKVGLGLFRSCLGIIFGLKTLICVCVFSSKGRYMYPKFKMLAQILDPWEVISIIFRVKKGCFLDFLKAVMVLLKFLGHYF